MKTLRQHKTWIVLITFLLAFAGCKGESPTAPAPGGNPNPPGTTIPPSGVSVTLTASNTEPLVDSSVVITATVMQNNAPVPNGTAVEFSSSVQNTLDGGSTSIIKTTTNGTATVTLSSGAAGPVRVTATVNNVTRTVDVTFKARSTTPPPANTTPTITAITPAVGRPQGGETIRITGTNFKAPVRVLFDTGAATPIEAFVVSVSDTVIEVISPAVNLGAGQQLAADVIVLTQAGSTSEQRIEATGGFTFRNEQLTPIVSTASPNSGPVTGGTMVTIFGEGFQAPVQVLFGSAEARVIEVNYSQIRVESPAGRDTSPNGSGTVTGPVDITVRNINSNTSVVAGGAFRYTAAMQITAAGPTEGLPTGGTRVTIDGIGFLAPVAVTIGGVAAQPISVSGTRIIALTSPVDINGCADASGPITVTNVNNGDQASGPAFTYRVPKPIIVGLGGNPGLPGSAITVSVLNAGLFPQLKIGSRNAAITSTTTNADGTITTFTTVIPSSIELDTVACPSGGSRQVPTDFDITFTSADTGCTFTLPGGLTVNPVQLGRLFLTPNPLELTATSNDPATPEDETRPGSGTFTIVNTGAVDLTITSVTGTGNPAFTVTSDPSGTTLGPCESTIVAVRYGPEAAGSASSEQYTVSATTGTPSQVITARETVIGRTQ